MKIHTTSEWGKAGPRRIYRSGSQTIGADFYGKGLRCAHRYCRAVGFFSSSAFEVSNSAFLEFFAAGHSMHLVCSPWLSQRDAERLTSAVHKRPEALSMFTSLEDWRARFVPQRHGWNAVLPWLVAQGLVQVRFAVVGRESEGVMYHEKLGYFADHTGKIVAYQGSANESLRGLQDNFERIEVYADWWAESDRQRARQVQLHFDLLWANQTPGLEVVTLLEACQRRLLCIRDLPYFPHHVLSQPPTVQRWPQGDAMGEVMIPPAEMTPFPHQEAAISAWGQAGGRGILEMATGAGKTFTALTAASRIYDRLGGKGLALIVVAPFLHLVDQWGQEARRFGLMPIRCAEGRARWEEALSSAVFALNHGQRTVLSVVVTQSTLCSPVFADIVGRLKKITLLIADEVHNYGTAQALRALPTKAHLRLGLSATPDRWLDEDGTQALKSYFGEVVYRYSLKKAMEDQILTPYRYYPVLVELEEDELDVYMELTRLLTRYMHKDEVQKGDSLALKVLIKRARLLASARNKLPVLKAALESYPEKSHILVYCGDGQVEQDANEETQRQIKAVVQMINHDLGMTAALYTADTSTGDRQALLQHFAQGSVQVLVAIRCLDEGVDVPATRAAFLLASSTNPRQFIQRRGRVLRRSPGKRRADIYDFFVAPPVDDLVGKDSYLRVVRSLFKRQLDRALEFTELASNGPQARRVLRGVADSLDLTGLW